MSAVERVHVRMMREKRRGGKTSAVERVHVRRMREERRGGKTYAVERVHVRRMREEGRTNVCGKEGACEKDEGGGGEDKCLR